MGRVIEQTVYEALEPGVYRAQLTAAAFEDGQYGEQLALRWDFTEPGFEGRSIRMWANPKLTGGKKPSKLYTICSMLLFGGKQLPEGWTLDVDTLLDREARLVIETRQDTGFNRIAQVLPIRTAKAAPAPAAARASAPATTQLQPRPPAAAVLATTPTTAADEPPDYVDADELPF